MSTSINIIIIIAKDYIKMDDGDILPTRASSNNYELYLKSKYNTDPIYFIKRHSWCYCELIGSCYLKENCLFLLY